MITGTDLMSLSVLEALQTGAKVKDIPSLFPISLDQAKRLSRYANMLEQAQVSLSAESVKQLKAIGLKSIYLAPLFQVQDWEGLNEVLAVMDEKTKRDDIPGLILALQEKRERVNDLKRQVQIRRRNMDLIEEAQKKHIKHLEKLQAKMTKGLEVIKHYDADTQAFLLEHVGVHEVYDHFTREMKEVYTLIKRLDSNFQAKLKKENIISYSSMHYVHQILSMDKFVAAYHERRKNKRAGLLWNPEIERKRAEKKEDSYYYPPHVPESGRYKNGNSLVSSGVKEKIKLVKTELAALEQQKKDIEKEIRLLEKESVQSFIEAVQRPTLSNTQIRLHQQLQNEAGKWLYSRGYAVVFEFTLPNGRRVDVAGVNEEGNVIFIEVKASRADYLADQKWTDYLPYCHELYFLGEYRQVQYEWERVGREKAGFLYQKGNIIEVMEPCPHEHEVKYAHEMLFSIARAASKKVVYGF